MDGPLGRVGDRRHRGRGEEVVFPSPEDQEVAAKAINDTEPEARTGRHPGSRSGALLDS